MRKPGGYGTLVQIRKIKPVPILLFGKELWEKVIHFDALVEAGTISPAELSLFHYVEHAEEACEIIGFAYER